MLQQLNVKTNKKIENQFDLLKFFANFVFDISTIIKIANKFSTINSNFSTNVTFDISITIDFSMTTNIVKKFFAIDFIQFFVDVNLFANDLKKKFAKIENVDLFRISIKQFTSTKRSFTNNLIKFVEFDFVYSTFDINFHLIDELLYHVKKKHCQILHFEKCN